MDGRETAVGVWCRLKGNSSSDVMETAVGVWCGLKGNSSMGMVQIKGKQQ